MKRNKFILGSVGVAAVAVVSALSWKGAEANYTKENLSTLQQKSASDYQEWVNARMTDVETGERVTPENLRNIKKDMSKLSRLKAGSFYFLGPDNIGGRTRAICIDRGYDNRIWAGGVSGGLWVTLNNANAWHRVDTYPGSPYISSMTMTVDRKLFVATGSLHDNWNGDGMWMSEDYGVTWSQVPGTSGFSTITEVVSDNSNNVVWMATSTGLKKYNNASGTIDNVTLGTGSSPISALDISKDGSTIIVCRGSIQTYVSTDGGATFTLKSGNTGGLIPTIGSRIEYAISATKNENNFYTIYASRTYNGGNIAGMNISKDGGNTWTQFVGSVPTDSPTLSIYREQGGYNSILSVVPYNNEKLMIGGIDVWKWEEITANPEPVGGFEKLSNWFATPSSPSYVHADNHEMKWDSNHRLYIGNDGGIGKSEDLENFWPANRGYNVTQFYAMAYDKDGYVIGGTQDNGTLYNDHTLSTWAEFREVNGGDGFNCDISFFNSDVMFSTIYYNQLSRSGDGGESFTSFIPSLPGTYTPIGTAGAHPFHTSTFFYEYYDENSEDSVLFIPTREYEANETLMVPSLASGDTMVYVTPVALAFSDTVDYDPALTQQDVIISGVRNPNAADADTNNYNLTFLTWVHTAGSPSQMDPPVAGDTLMIDFVTQINSTTTETSTDTVFVLDVTFQDHFYGQNTDTGEQVDMGALTQIYNVAWDTVKVQDPYQSWMFMYIAANGGEIWGTRDAARFATVPSWVLVARGVGSSSFASWEVEASKDLNNVFVSGSGGVHRIDGLGSLYTSDPDFNTKAGYHYVGGNQEPPTDVVMTKISNLVLEGIALNPNNPNDLALFQGYGGQIRRASNAATATGTGDLSVVTLSAISSPNPAVYDGIIDRNDPNVLVLGTSNGAVVTEDGGASYYDASAGFEGVPVYQVRQSWRTYEEGNNRDGEIYLATHGRGIWASESFLGVEDENGISNEDINFKSNLRTFPNPTTSTTALSFNLNGDSDVELNIYDFSGKLVKTISKKNMLKGTQTIEINAADLNRGTYIIKFKAGEKVETAKFIKM